MERTPSHRIAGLRKTGTLRDAIETLLAEYCANLAEKRLVVDVDLQEVVATSNCSADLFHTIDRMLKLAIGRCPVGSELSVSALKTVRGLEIEVADSGLNRYHEPQNRVAAFTADRLAGFPGDKGPEDPQANNESYLEFYCRRCPQGGLAWSVVDRWRMLAEKVA